MKIMMHSILAGLFFFVFHSCNPSYKEANIDKPVNHTKPEIPTVVHVGMVSPSILGITIMERYLVPSTLSEYVPEKGDSVSYHIDKNGIVHSRILYRNGNQIGYLAGKDENVLCTFERIGGDTIQHIEYIEKPGTYVISSPNDMNYGEGRNPDRVFRKSKINTWANPEKEFCMIHTVYLELPIGFNKDGVYHIDIQHMNISPADITYVHEPENIRSESVHITQVGFRPDDPVKRGYLSIWLGTGGGYSFMDPVEFSLLDVETGKEVYNGDGTLALRTDGVETIKEQKNYSKTEVWQLDFSAYNEPGDYVLFVKNIGCSYPFRIEDNVYSEAFDITMKGFLSHRSGIKLENGYQRPVCFHPEDMKIYYSDFSILDNWMYKSGSQGDVFVGLLENKADDTVANAWGGYMDAGDWDRRAQHLQATRQLLELNEMHPQYYRNHSMDIPEKDNNIPDILDECMWNIDFYKRMQTTEGGIPHGVESAAHPVAGEPSWMESLPVMRFKPDAWSSFIYAGVAAKLSRALEPINEELHETYKISALGAMEFGINELKSLEKLPAFEKLSPGRKQAIREQMMIAALELYYLTGDKHWHNLFKKDAGFVSEVTNNWENISTSQLDAAFVYLTLPDSLSEEILKKNAVSLLLMRADACKEMAHNNAFNLSNRIPTIPMLNGFYSAINNQELCRAHFLTGKKEYLEAAVLASQFTAGANPMNMTYTVDLGYFSVQRPLHLDSRNSGQEAPSGITVYAQSDYEYFKNEVAEKSQGFSGNWALWGVFWFTAKYNVPSGWVWPPHECYFDASGFPSYNEYTIHQVFGPVSYGYGYLNSRP